MKRIAIIGAGMAGLTLANELKAFADVQVYEKSRDYGGRMATRCRNNYQFDHGAQFFIAKTPAFKEFLKPFIQKNLVARWDARFVELTGNDVTYRWTWTDEVPHYVAASSMSTLGKAMAKDLPVQLGTHVNEIKKNGQQWQLTDSEGKVLGSYEWVILAIPAKQVIELVPDECKFNKDVAEKNMSACYSLMLGFKEALPLEWDAALVKETNISWVCNNHSKPGRANRYSLLIHSTNQWAEENIELDNEVVTKFLIQETSAVIKQDVSVAEHIDLHRWRYANIQKQYGDRSFIDNSNRLAAIGDWCIKGRIESAFLSALDGATKLKQLL